jgi:orotidine-5'-phosphate decarboxylase
MGPHFADTLLERIADKGSPVCVGLDPVYEKLPQELRAAGATLEQKAEAVGQFCREVIAAVAPHVPAVKPQIACFERYGWWGVREYYRIVATAAAAGLSVIGDVKRGDIGSTAEAYADAHLRTLGDDSAAQAASADAITVNGYFGDDGLEPFITAAAAGGKGIFVLVRTSNPGGAAVQNFAGPAGRPFFLHMAEQVAQAGQRAELIGASGYSCVGAVVGATYPQEARLLRTVMKRQIFLVPGYGAQGASAADCAAAFDAHGRGALVNASRSVIYAYAQKKDVPWRKAIADAAAEFARDIAGALKK